MKGTEEAGKKVNLQLKGKLTEHGKKLFMGAVPNQQALRTGAPSIRYRVDVVLDGEVIHSEIVLAYTRDDAIGKIYGSGLTFVTKEIEFVKGIESEKDNVSTE